MQVFSNQAFICGGAGGTQQISVLTDTAGVATVGTAISVPAASNMVGYLSTGKVFLASTVAGGSVYYQFGISSGAAVLEKTFQSLTDTTTLTAKCFITNGYTNPLSGLPQSASNSSATILRTSSGKSAPGTSALYPFTISIDGSYPAKLQQSANPFSTVSTFNDGISDAVNWAIASTQAASTTTIQLRKVTLA